MRAFRAVSRANFIYFNKQPLHRIGSLNYPAAMKPTKIKCDCCAGSGFAQLPEVYQRTLDAIPKDRFVSTLEIIDALDEQFVASTAVNNRLRIFLQDKWKLVTSERRGKSLFWKRIK